MGSLALKIIQSVDKKAEVMTPQDHAFWESQVTGAFEEYIDRKGVKEFLGGVCTSLDLRLLHNPYFAKDRAFIEHAIVLKKIFRKAIEVNTPEAQKIAQAVQGYFGVQFFMHEGVLNIRPATVEECKKNYQDFCNAIDEKSSFKTNVMASATSMQGEIAADPVKWDKESRKSHGILDEKIPEKVAEYLEQSGDKAENYVFNDENNENYIKIQAALNEARFQDFIVESYYEVDDHDSKVFTHMVEKERFADTQTGRLYDVEDLNPPASIAKCMKKMEKLISHININTDAGAKYFGDSLGVYASINPERGLKLIENKLGLWKMTAPESSRFKLFDDAGDALPETLRNASGSEDFYQPFKRDLIILDSVQKAMDGFKIGSEERRAPLNTIFEKQLEKTLESCRTYLESRKELGWTEKGNQKFNSVLAFYAKFRKEDAQRLLNDRNAIIDGYDGHKSWFFKPTERFGTVDALMEEKDYLKVSGINDDLDRVRTMDAIIKNWKYVSKDTNVQNLSRENIKEIMNTQAFENVINSDKDLYTLSEGNGKELAKMFRDEIRKIGTAAKSASSKANEIGEQTPGVEKETPTMMM